jgi:FixJ family two-component response regulator
MSKPTVFIVDDDLSARRGLTRLIRAAGLNAESFASAADFLASGKTDGPGCIVLDVKMPEMDGPSLQKRMVKAEYAMPIVFLSGHADIPTAARAMKMGAVDFLTKPVDSDDLLDAVRLSLARDAKNRARRTENSAIKKQIRTLTPREHEVMTYVITGMPNKRIAYELGISETTVKIHRGRVMQKLDIESVAELVRICEKSGVDPAEPRR